MYNIYYDFDISFYKSNDKNINSSNILKIFDITNKYKSCKWYASECGPFNKSNSRCTIDICFEIDDTQELFKIINDINSVSNLFFTTITKVDKNILDEDLQYSHIYANNDFLEQIIPKYKKIYEENLNNMFPIDKMLHDSVYHK